MGLAVTGKGNGANRLPVIKTGHRVTISGPKTSHAIVKLVLTAGQAGFELVDPIGALYCRQPDDDPHDPNCRPRCQLRHQK